MDFKRENGLHKVHLEPRANKVTKETTDSVNKELKMALNLEAFKTKTKDGRRAFARMNRQKNPELDIIMKDLVVLETQLRQEQSKILSLLVHKDMTINDQQQEIEKLRRDNERLISRIKKITGGGGGGKSKKEEKDNVPLKEKRECWSMGPLSSSSGGLRANHNLATNNTVFSLLTSQFYEKTCLQYTDKNGQFTERVLHKPPIAKKPKFASGSGNPLPQPVTAIVRQRNGQCSIVSTISRLLEEESDQGLTESSSEPSSPDATLKLTSAPRVLKLAHQFERGLLGSDSSGDHRSRDLSSKTMFILDEHEVTSGYNSDAISDQDPDYENVIVVRERSNSDPSSKPNHEESDDNYVILRAAHGQLLDNADLDDFHTYSNIEYCNGDSIDGLEEVFEADNNNLHSVDDRLNTEPLATYLQSDCDVKNVPRSRHNINLIMEAGPGESRLMDNFEEFSLDSLDMEDNNGETIAPSELRLCGDGAEAKQNTVVLIEQGDSKGSQATGGYEKFLEVTGLSQKSILTPSRMFSNHRSVLKPRDIKYRDKLRAAFTSLPVVDENSTSSFPATSQPQRYWREPYSV